jgi:hypothetical protein
MDEATPSPPPRRGYLFACGLALLAAVLGVAAPSSDGEPMPGGRSTVILVALAAVGIFAVAAARLRDASGEGPAGDRLRRMTAIWLGLAVLLGAAVLRAPVLALWSAGPGALGGAQWLAATAGAAIVVVALLRGLTLLRR